MGGFCGGGIPHFPISSGCSQGRGPDWGWEGGGGAVMVGRRDQGGMTIWWSSSMHMHTPLWETLPHFYMPVSLALTWATAPRADSFCPGLTAQRILHRYGGQRPLVPIHFLFWFAWGELAAVEVSLTNVWRCNLSCISWSNVLCAKWGRKVCGGDINAWRQNQLLLIWCTVKTYTLT